MRQRSRRGSWGVAALVVVGLATGGCSGSERRRGPVDAEPRRRRARPGDARGRDDRVALGELAGRLPQARREQLAGDVQRGRRRLDRRGVPRGDYPRTDFAGLVAGLHRPGAGPGPARRRPDEQPRPRRRRSTGSSREKRQVTLDVLASRSEPAGVTARVVLRFATTGDTRRTVRVAGRLYLTKGKQGWQVFGYDVTKDAR